MTVVTFCTGEKCAYCTLVFSFFRLLYLGGHSRGLGFDGHILSIVQTRALAQLQTFHLRPRVDGIPGSKSSNAPIGTGTRLASRRDVHFTIGACSSPPGELSPISIFESGYDEGPLRHRFGSDSVINQGGAAPRTGQSRLQVHLWVRYHLHHLSLRYPGHSFWGSCLQVDYPVYYYQHCCHWRDGGAGLEL